MPRSLLRSVDSTLFASRGLHPCGTPGRTAPLARFEAESAHAGTRCVVCWADLERAGGESPDYARRVVAGVFPMPTRRFPIRDLGVPAPGMPFGSFARWAAGWLRTGERLALRCGAEIGRTGMTVVCVRCALGAPLEEAHECVAAAGSSCEGEIQKEFVRAFASRVNVEGAP